MLHDLSTISILRHPPSELSHKSIERTSPFRLGIRWFRFRFAAVKQRSISCNGYIATNSSHSLHSLFQRCYCLLLNNPVFLASLRKIFIFVDFTGELYPPEFVLANTSISHWSRPVGCTNRIKRLSVEINDWILTEDLSTNK
jgi:hypothetical protein